MKVPVIASLNGVTKGGWLSYAKQMQQAGADALELNVYYLPTDPAVSAEQVEGTAVEMVKEVKKGITIPVAVKLAPFYSSLPHFAQRLEAAGADGLVLFNRFYQPDIDVEELEVKRTLQLLDLGRAEPAPALAGDPLRARAPVAGGRRAACTRRPTS